MVSDLESQPDMEIEDLWPAFVATHADLQVPSPLTRDVYLTYAPILGPWLMRTQGLSAEAAQVGIESIWASLVVLTGAQASYRFLALDAVLRTACPRCVSRTARPAATPSVTATPFRRSMALLQGRSPRGCRGLRAPRARRVRRP